jgi:hypothetical protein
VQKFGEWPLPQSDNNEQLEQATLIVLRARELVARQREIIAELKAKGLDTTAAEFRLRYLEQLLMMFENELAKIPKP